MLPSAMLVAAKSLRTKMHGAVAVLGADSPIGLTIVRELGARGVGVIAMGRSQRALARFSRHSADFGLIEGPLADWLPEWIAQRDVAAIFATSEGLLLELAALKDQLGKCQVLSPDQARLDLVLDKARTLAAAQALGIAVPSSWQPQAGDDLAARADEIAYPVAVKWADPNAVMAPLEHAGLALEKVEYAQDAAALLAILSRYDGIGQYPLVQQYCPGVGLGQMFNMAGGKATLRFQHQRLREFPPSGGVSSMCRSVPLDQHGELMAKSEALLAALGWEGPAMVEYRHDPASGQSWLMEINGRFWGSIPLAWHCGAHFAWEHYRLAVKGEAPGPVKGPLRQRRARYVIPDAKHIVLVLRDGSLSLTRRIAALGRWVVDFLDPRVRYYVWTLSDPGPFFGDIWGILRGW